MTWSPQRRVASQEDRPRSAVFAVSTSVVIGGLMLWISVYLFSSYGASLFLGTPLLMGAAAAYLYNQPHSRAILRRFVLAWRRSLLPAAPALVRARGSAVRGHGSAAWLPIGAWGASWARRSPRLRAARPAGLMAAVLVLPLLAGVEAMLFHSASMSFSRPSKLTVPPAAVWEHVVEFPDLPESREWYFTLGIACPERARIIGTGPVLRGTASSAPGHSSNRSPPGSLLGGWRLTSPSSRPPWSN